MLLFKLFAQGTKLIDENKRKECFSWLESKLDDPIEKLDASYAYWRLLDYANEESKYEKAEVNIHKICSEIIRSHGKEKSLIVAKAYTYSGLFKEYAVDRHKYANKALEILGRSQGKAEKDEVEFLKYCCEKMLKGHGRPTLFYLDNNDNFIVDEDVTTKK